MTLVIATAVVRLLIWLLLFIIGLRFGRFGTALVGALGIGLNLAILLHGGNGSAIRLLSILSSGLIAYLLIDRLQAMPEQRRQRANTKSWF